MQAMPFYSENLNSGVPVQHWQRQQLHSELSGSTVADADASGESQQQRQAQEEKEDEDQDLEEDKQQQLPACLLHLLGGSPDADAAACAAAIAADAAAPFLKGASARRARAVAHRGPNWFLDLLAKVCPAAPLCAHSTASLPLKLRQRSSAQVSYAIVLITACTYLSQYPNLCCLNATGVLLLKVLLIPMHESHGCPMTL
jgi:hypothetical protein